MDASKLVKVYVKMRDAKEAIAREYDTKIAELQEQMDIVEQELLTICKDTGQDGGKTPYGSFSRTVKTRYWTSDWDNMYAFIRTHDAPELLERRIHQGNFKEFMIDHPEVMPIGLNSDSKYSITVRRASK